MAYKKKLIRFVDYYSNAMLPVYGRMKEMNFDVGLVKPKKRLGFTTHLRPHWYDKVVDKADIYLITVRRRHMTPLDKSIFCVHGIGLEEAIKFDEQYKAVWVTGPQWMEEYKKVFSKQHWHRLIPVGFPPLERLLSREVKEKAEEIKKTFSLGERPTLLFGVLGETNEAESDLISRALRELEYIAGELRINLIVKPGFRNVWGPRFPHNRYRELKEKVEGKSFIHILSSREDILPFYHVSDILISGRCSSVITEFMTLDKPTIQIVSDHSYRITLDKLGSIGSMEDDKTPYIDAGLHGETKNLKEYVMQSLRNPSEFSKERKIWVDGSVYNPVGTIERAIEGIKNFL